MSPWLILLGLLITYILTTPPNETFNAYHDVRNFNLRVGLVTTVKDPHHLEDWIKYHLAIGFTKIYIIFDDPQDSSIPIARKFPNNQVETILPDNNWLSNYKSMKAFSKYGPTIESEVMSRQILNTESILRHFAPKDHLDWLFHLDCDELLNIPSPEKLPPKSPDSKNQYPLIRFLNQFPPHVQVLKIPNLEAAPTEANAENCFRQHTIFRKRNLGQFRAYHGTKSACRVNSFNHPMSVHFFVTTHPNGTSHTVPESKAQILHYVNCTYQDWLKKYQTLGKFPDNWWGHRPIRIKFHKKSRDVVQSGCPDPNQCSPTENDKLNQFYQESMLVTPDTPKSNLIQITTPSKILISSNIHN